MDTVTEILPFEDPMCGDENRSGRKKEELCQRILRHIRGRLYRYYPFLDGAFAALPAERSEDVRSFGTDGNRLLFSEDYILRIFSADPDQLCRVYLHTCLHCLYLHVIRNKEYERVWDLACDLAVEQILAREAAHNRFLERRETDERSRIIKEECMRMLGPGPASAERISQMLGDKSFPYTISELREVFGMDDHVCWLSPDDRQSADGIRKKWEKVREYSGYGQSKAAGAVGSSAGTSSERVELHRGGRNDYRKFLRRFAVMREEMLLDTESFDYIYYSCGMELYGNIPLIEPLEYKEVNRLEELVIAIDTSGSCSAEVVEKFLAETYDILEEKENFFSKMKVYLIQCDCVIQNVKIIHSEEEWRAMGSDIEIQGRGGTDFRPVFRYIRRQQEQRELRNLRALLYFTDGDGIFPGEAPEYETAFISAGRKNTDFRIPEWAHSFQLEDGLPERQENKFRTE